MKKISTIAAVTVCAVLLSACNSKKDASASNFTDILNEHFSQTCASIDPQPFGLAGRSDGYPVALVPYKSGSLTSQKAADKENAQAAAPYNVLVAAGLLTVKDGQAPSPFNPHGPLQPAKVYTLTDAGEKALADQKNKKGTAFCAGHFKVQSIANFTPAADVGGKTISEVEYTYKAVDVPAWASSSQFSAAFPDDTQTLTQEQHARETLILGNDGWFMENGPFARQ